MSQTQPIDVRDMHIVHATFRTAYTQSAQLVRANTTPSPQRVAFLADHVEFGLSMLHHHHESEDELLYPVLEARAPEQAARTEQIDEEHKAIATAIDESLARCATWRATPTAETGEALAASLDDLLAVLEPHLVDEEAEVVPLAARVLTKEEWEAIGAHSRASIPREKMSIAFGMLLEPLDEADRAHMRAQLPLPVRTLFYRPLIQRPWEKYKDQLLHGT
ncbi:MAG TPA: hemerythrin domain-containing protein [Candidatus Nanopelagicales bacterium]|nr:hemerythrin domain-containing protein [Candidatus Nanopelagicales bacterium]